MRKDEMGPSKAKAHERIFSLVKQRKGVDEVNMGSLVKTLVAPQKQKGKEKVHEPIVEWDEHIDFHSFESSGDVNSLIALLDAPRQKGGKQALKHAVVDEYLEKQEEEAPKVEKSFKEFLALVDDFRVFVVQQGEATTQNHEIAKLTNYIMEGLSAIGIARSGGCVNATIKVRLPNSFAGKETKTKWL